MRSGSGEDASAFFNEGEAALLSVVGGFSGSIQTGGFVPQGFEKVSILIALQDAFGEDRKSTRLNSSHG